VNRRQFLKNSGILIGSMGLSGSLLSRLAVAAEDLDHYFIFTYFEGGWDQLLSFDPRDPAIFNDAALGETGIQPGYDRLPADFSRSPIDIGPFSVGPAIGELANLSEEFSIIRGINMATLTHEVGRRYFITGRPPSGTNARGSSIATLATEQIGSDAPVPNLSLGVESYIESHIAPFATAMTIQNVREVKYLLQESLGIPTLIRQGVRDAVATYWQHKNPCNLGGAGASRLGDAYRDNRERARELVKAELHTNFDFESNAHAPLREHYGFAYDTLDSSYGRAALAAQAIKTGLSRTVSIRLATGLDNHDGSWATNHCVALRDGFNGLARLITDLRDSESPTGGSYLSKTTIIAFSEFARTARLNNRGGRDHILTNCALLAGAGVKPSTVIGSSNDHGMAPDLVDLKTGLPDDNGVSLKPEHVMSTALAAAGLSASSLQSEPIEALLL
jgi:uncharacterized protein (DUF1501 family)